MCAPSQVATLIETPAGNSAVVHGDAAPSRRSREALAALIDAATTDMNARRGGDGPDPIEPKTQEEWR